METEPSLQSGPLASKKEAWGGDEPKGLLTVDSYIKRRSTFHVDEAAQEKTSDKGSNGSSGKRKTVQTMTMNDFEEEQELLEEDAFHMPHDGKPLEDADPFIGMLTYMKSFVSPMKIGTFIFLAILTLVGALLLDDTQFNIKAKVPHVKDAVGCLSICEQTHTDSDLAATLGGKGICSTVSFKECSAKSKYPKMKLSDCAKPGTDPTADSTKCSFTVTPPKWKPFVTMFIFVMAAEGCFEDGPPDILLIGAGCILTALGVISRTELFSGMTNSGVLGLAVLGPISKAIGNSGIMERILGVMLGSPQSLAVALFRMMIPVALFSAFLSNTATVAIMIPVIVSWSNRLQVHPGQLLMPLSFAAQLGGSMTLLGSSHCLVAKGAIPADYYDMQFFDLTPVGTMLTLATAFAIWLVVKFTSFLRSSAEAPTIIASDDDSLDVYTWPFIVSGGGLVGRTVEEAGLARLAGVVEVKHADGIARPMQNDDAMVAITNERGIVALRKITGVLPRNSKDLAALGRQRHHRFLYEVGIREGTEVFANGLPSAEKMRHDFVACFVAGPKLPYNPSKDADAEKGVPDKTQDAAIAGNCIMLIEADERAVANKALYCNEFVLIHKVHFSSPPRQGLPVDRWRALSTFFGFLIIIALVTAKAVKLDYGGGLLCLFYLFTRALSREEFMSSFNPSILGTIVGALAMGAALQKSGFCDFLSKVMVTVAEPFGAPGITVMIYVVSWLMGLVINNSAIVAILGPMLTSVVDRDPALKMKGLVWTLVFAAGTCFTTPLGYQTNLMVIKDGKYTFGDFARFGATIQFLHFIFTVVLITIFTPFLA